MRPLIEAHNLRKAYGLQTVFEDLSFVVREGAHIALIGRNGAGKTTLLRALSKDEDADSGTVRYLPAARVGVLRQHEALPTEETATDWLCRETGKPSWEVGKLAARFALRPDDLAKIPSTLSGGYQMRLKIVRLLLDDPNLLLLDEPVNYLDLPTLLLLETFLADYPGAFIMTSHDREVLQNCCTETWEIERGSLTEFPAPVETYLDWKEEQAEYVRRTNKRLRREMSEAQAFADRFRAKASLSSRAQSKLRHIAKLRTQLRDELGALPTTAFRIPCPLTPPGPGVRAKDLTIGYGDNAIATEINFELQRGAKVAIVGENGRGKSTLLKTLAGVLPALAGEAKWWHKADIGYFAQMSTDALLAHETVLQALTRAAPSSASGEHILAAAGAFLFRNDDLEKPCGVLSGGERSRVRLACLVLRSHNVLILDEPTNHLDAETVEALARALKSYEGTVILVSHARTFMNAIIDTIYEVRGGSVRHYTGTYEEYVNDLVALAREVSVNALPASPPEHNRDTRKEHALLLREKRRAQQKLTARIDTLDKEKSGILAYFFENPTDYAPEKSRRLSELEEEMAAVERDWLKLEEEIQALE